MEVRDWVGARRRRAAVALVGAGLALVAFAAPAAEAKGGAKAKITRSAHGIPTIESDTYKGLGFGYGYAFAQDNICTIAEAYVTANGERSRYFGADAKTPDGFTNLQSDLFFQRIKDRGTVEDLIAQKPPNGPKRNVKQVVNGYVAGYDRYLEQTGVDNLPDPTCAGAPWVRPITKMDVYRRFYQLTEFASGAVAIDGIADAQPPPPARAQAGAAAAPQLPSDAEVQQLGDSLAASRGLGSNGWGLGSEATENRSGMVLANPHFPWQGSERFYQSHLMIPGKVNVSGASLFGAPVILIGHTENARLDAHRLDRVPVRPGPARAGARRPDQLPGRRPAGEDGVQRRHRADPAAGRLARSR